VCLAGAGGYSAVLDVNDSDHKPVFAQLQVQLPWYNQEQLLRTSLQRLWQAASLVGDSGGSGCVTLRAQPQQLLLPGSYVPGSLVLTNPSSSAAVLYTLVCTACGGHSTTAGPALPTWLEVTPAAGLIPPGQSVRLRVQGSKAAAWGGPGGGLGCELRVAAVQEGSVDSARWPVASLGAAAAVAVMLP
jgi:hypothetical protein